MATDQPPPDDLDPGHVMDQDTWDAVERAREELLRKESGHEG